MAAEGRDRPAVLGSIRARTTLAATVVVAAALLLGGLLVTLVLRQNLIDHRDGAARRRAQDVGALVGQGSLPPILASAGEEDAAVQVIDARGRVLSATENLRGAPSLVLERAGPGRARTVSGLPIEDEQDDDFRVVSVTVTGPGGRATVHVAESLEPVDETVATVRGALLAAFPVLILLVAATTWAVVGRTLRPVDAIRSQMAEISASDLSRRVPSPGTDDEIGRLADTMNAMLDRLEDFADRQRRFVADASHELQSPLATTLADLEVALADPGRVDWQATASGVAGDAQRMTKLVQDLLFLARVDDREVAVPRTLIDLDDVVHDEVARFRDRAPVAVEVDVAPAEVRGSSDQLARVVRNLLDNAGRYARSRIGVELGAHDGTVVLTVDDDGPGVPAGEEQRVFERFARLDESRSRETGGTGLGLAIAREIVEHHDGTIAVESNGPGARFVVRLPAGV
jgi:signal transduction histidine kinase